MSEISASTDLGNGFGCVYITDDSGALGTVWGYPQGIVNNILAVNAIKKDFGPRNSRYAGAGYAVGYMTLTNAAADNLNTLTIGGVNQISGVVAMTAGDLSASASSIAAAVNAFVATPNFIASASGAMVIFTSEVATDAYNGDLVAPSFSGASTATTIPVGGGRSIGSRPFRFFIDARSAASPSSIAGAAIEITDAVSWNDLSAPVTVATGTIASNTLSFQRLNDGSRMQVQIDGVTTVGAANEITSIAFEGGCYGDIVLFTGVTGGGAPAVFIQNADIGIELASKSLASETDVLEMRYIGAGKFSQVIPNAMDAAALRAQGVAIPATPGVTQFPPAGGTLIIQAGGSGVVPPGTSYKHDVGLTGAGVVLGSDLEFRVETAASGKDGDSGTICGNNVPITVGANAVNFSDPNGIKAKLTAEMALSGQWVVQWTVLDAANEVVGFSVVPMFSTLNSQYLDTGMYKDLSVTGAKIAATTIDGGAKLIDDSITEAKLDAIVRAKLNAQGRTTVTVSIPTAQVLTLNSDPVLAIPAPGAGYAIVIEKVFGRIAYVAPVYATNVNLQVIYSGAGDAIAESSLVLVKTTSAMQEIPFLYAISAGATQVVENADVYIRVETGDPTAGASDLTVYITYSLIQL